MDTQNYKRTLAGSVGAGMGAIMNGSGRTYFILEHKNSSKYHQAGEAQKIIVDQIELGRADSCQVRFDESFETVSRRHAAIQREGENWKLIHLSQANPTLVNGRPINGTYYLQSGDEIQLSVGGPRLGFIVPQGRQALTSSIGMTERMNLFRQQALRPYKTALTVLSVVLILAIAGLVAWNLYMKDDFERKLAEKEVVVDQIQTDLDKAKAEADQIKADLEAGKIAKDKADKMLTEQNNVISGLQNQLYINKKELDEIKIASEKEVIAKSRYKQKEIEEDPDPRPILTDLPTASTDLKDYYDHIYTIKIDRIEIEYAGQRIDPGIQLSDVVCGTGFMLDDGTFITDRQNVQPWVYNIEGQWKEPWRHLMAQFVACGADVIIHYRAYSTKGTGKPLTFVNTDFVVNETGDADLVVEIERGFRRAWKSYFGVTITEWTAKKYHMKVGVISKTSRSYAYIRNLGVNGEGIPCDVETSTNMSGGTEIHMVGYARKTNEHNLVPQHFNDKTNVDDTQNGTIILQGQVGEAGYYGSPAFYKDENGQYRIIGVMVGSVYGRDRLVPMKNILR